MTAYALELAGLMAVFSVVIVVPGADLALVVRQCLTHGRRTAIFTSFGLGASLLCHVGYTILGIGLIVSQSIIAFNIVKWCGAAYLLYLGVQSIRQAESPAAAVKAEAPGGKTPSPLRAFSMGFVTNALNPKAVVFFLSLFSTLVSFETPALVKLGYGLVMATALIAWFVGVSYFFTLPAVREAFQRAGRWILRVTGLVFIGLAVKLSTERLNG